MNNDRLRRVRDEIFRYRLISYLCIVITVFTTVWYQVKIVKITNYWENELASQEAFDDNVMNVIKELRTYEYELNLLNAGIESKQCTIEQNIDTAYRILQAKSSRTTDDELMRVINERVLTLRETMTTADLFQAIAVMKENFPAAHYEELDALYEKNQELIGQITRTKEQYNRLVHEYDSVIQSHGEALQLVKFTRFNFKEYALGEEESVEEPAKESTEAETEEETTVYVEPEAVG